jgi:hypothetical protein
MKYGRRVGCITRASRPPSEREREGGPSPSLPPPCRAGGWRSRFHEFIARFAPDADLPVFVDEPGIWLCSKHPYLAGSPDDQAAAGGHRAAA